MFSDMPFVRPSVCPSDLLSVRPAGRPAAVHCPLTPISHDTIFLYVMEEFQ